MKIDAIADDAFDKIVAAYWSACDQKQAAVDPFNLTKLDWVEELLGEQFDIAMRCEADPEGWDQARQKW